MHVAQIMSRELVTATPHMPVLEVTRLLSQRHLSAVPVVDSDGKSTVLRILAYSGALIPVSLMPFALGMAGRVYLIGAILMGAALFRVSMGMAYPRLPATAAASKPSARRLLQATIIYLPALFALMMANPVG